ncbi:hypothetical protein JOF56_011615 [Kibdelosporangium banguiense]|uniref:DUF2746 domain-containing protein n=1 Tax=Kibdelosporangium banguiense TaxID=1365924 RepID=A0ABS4U3K2_9PSEU|nr:hypothetical protein [Kibdelosporangium banguiense]MBP2331230.1 hypothetical protein [Kibdelosporangium banguiense]
MPTWFTNLTIGQILLFVGGLVLVVGLFAKVWKAIRPVWRGTGNFLEDWNGEPERPGVPAKPGVMERLRAIEQKVDGIDHELHPNSGQSLRDQVDSIRTELREHIAQQQG